MLFVLASISVEVVSLCAFCVFSQYGGVPRRNCVPWTLVTILRDLGTLFYILSDYRELQLLFLLFMLHCQWHLGLFDAKFMVRNRGLNGSDWCYRESSLVYIGSPCGRLHRRDVGNRYPPFLKLKTTATTKSLSSQYLFALPPAARKKQ